MSAMVVGNQLLARLAADERDVIAPCLEVVEYAPGDVLVESNVPASHAYFIESGIAATVLGNKAGQSVEVGLTGREGMIGLPVVLGVRQCPRRTVMLVEGKVQRVSSKALMSALDGMPEFRATLLAFIHTFLIQLSSSAFATGSLTVEKRLARWLLMAQDRLDSPEIFLTHDFYAMVLGVRRPGVTNALHLLEGEHLIQSKRGRTVILDRARLEGLVGFSSYGLAENEYKRLFDPGSHHSAGRSLDGAASLAVCVDGSPAG